MHLRQMGSKGCEVALGIEDRLAMLFESGFAGSLAFKSGTSLSKVFGVIERFSEDIDLSLSPELLKLPEAGTSRNQAIKWMTRTEAAWGASVRDQIAPVLEAAAEAVLGKRNGGWFEFLTDPHTHSPVLLFHYPSSGLLPTSSRRADTGCGRGSPMLSPRRFSTDDAKSLLGKSSGAYGRKPRSSRGIPPASRKADAG